MILRRLSTEAWYCSRMHADLFNNDRIMAVGLSFHVKVLCIYVAFIAVGHMVEYFYIIQICFILIK